jgi:hypothetical protein
MMTLSWSAEGRGTAADSGQSEFDRVCALEDGHLAVADHKRHGGHLLNGLEDVGRVCMLQFTYAHPRRVRIGLG